MRAITRKERVSALEKSVDDTIKKSKTDQRVFFVIVLISTVALVSLLHTMMGGFKP